MINLIKHKSTKFNPNTFQPILELSIEVPGYQELIADAMAYGYEEELYEMLGRELAQHFKKEL